jgi:hypothetical protein
MNANRRESLGARPSRSPRGASRDLPRKEGYGQGCVRREPNTAVERSEQSKSGPLSGLTALPMDRISEYLRRFACIGGLKQNSRKSLIFRITLRKSLICKTDLM